jgi:hypothetical protein
MAPLRSWLLLVAAACCAVEGFRLPMRPTMTASKTKQAKQQHANKASAPPAVVRKPPTASAKAEAPLRDSFSSPLANTDGSR